MATFAPTAVMRPFVMTTVPFSIGGPLTGKTFPPVMAIVCARAVPASDRNASAENATAAIWNFL
jgi:hypothetical protein